MAKEVGLRRKETLFIPSFCLFHLCLCSVHRYKLAFVVVSLIDRVLDIIFALVVFWINVALC